MGALLPPERGTWEKSGLRKLKPSHSRGRERSECLCHGGASQTSTRLSEDRPTADDPEHIKARSASRLGPGYFFFFSAGIHRCLRLSTPHSHTQHAEMSACPHEHTKCGGRLSTIQRQGITAANRPAAALFPPVTGKQVVWHSVQMLETWNPSRGGMLGMNPGHLCWRAKDRSGAFRSEPSCREPSPPAPIRSRHPVARTSSPTS